MAYITSSHPFEPHAGSWSARFLAIGASALAVLEILAAAGRVSQAVESRCEPAPSDLEILGIKGPLPRLR